MASTNDSKSFCRGSNPLVPANLQGLRQVVRQQTLTLLTSGSNPLAPANMDMWLSGLRQTAFAVVLKRIGNPCIHRGFESSHVQPNLLPQHNGECSCFVSSWLQVQVLQVAPLRPFSSVGQSRRLIIVWSTVQVSEGPPIRILSSAGRAVDF